MKKTFTLIAIVLLTASMFLPQRAGAQAPEKMSYQAIIRNSSDQLVTNQDIGMQISILQGSATGTLVYAETQSPTTNANGLVSIEIGTGTTSDVFSAIDWANGPYFIKTETDPAGGTAYTITGTSQLLSVPYALHAKTAANIFSGNYTDLTGTPGNVSTFTNDAGYLTSISETDPLFTAWDKSYNDLTNKPDIIDSINTVIDTTTQFVRTEVDGDVTNEIQDLSLSSNTLSLTNDATTVDLSGYLDNTDNQNLSNVLSQGTNAGNNAIVNISQQGIGTSNPNASAALEISSTTQGFLPPRMTDVEMNALSPVTGLQVYNTTFNLPLFYNGSEWRKLDGSLYIGESYAGGIIFYIDDTGEHGLVCAENDQSTGAEWGCFGTAIPGADGTAVGTGAQNTIDIEAGCTTTGTAADICANLNSYSDWFLPSKDELNLMYTNLRLNGLGGFASAYYWSSTESSNDYAWTQHFSNGDQNYTSKLNTRRVRAIRAF